MATVHLNLLAVQARHAMDTNGQAEADAIREVLKENNYTDKQIEELGLIEAVRAEMNRDTEQEKKQAEADLAAQNPQQPEILKDQDSGDSEATLQEEKADYSPDVQ